MKAIAVAKGQILQKKGELNTKVYIVESGLLRSYSIDHKGKEHTFMFASENWVIADSCETNVPSDLFIDALEDSSIFVIDKDIAKKNSKLDALHRRLNVLQKRIIMLLGLKAPLT